MRIYAPLIATIFLFGCTGEAGTPADQPAAAAPVSILLFGDTSTVHVVTTPDSGSGETVLEYSREFARRSGLVTAQN